MKSLIWRPFVIPLGAMVKDTSSLLKSDYMITDIHANGHDIRAQAKTRMESSSIPRPLIVSGECDYCQATQIIKFVHPGMLSMLDKRSRDFAPGSLIYKRGRFLILQFLDSEPIQEELSALSAMLVGYFNYTHLIQEQRYFLYPDSVDLQGSLALDDLSWIQPQDLLSSSLLLCWQLELLSLEFR